MAFRIYLSPPHLSGNEQSYLQDAVASNWISSVGPYIDQFEKLISTKHQNAHVALCSSGTAAIHLGLKAMGVGEGDIVLCSAFTFAASVFPITYLKAQPVFIDSEAQTWNMCPELLEKAIQQLSDKNKKPKVILLVQLYGNMARMKEILAVADKWEIPVLEDAAEALGSTLEGRKAGTFGSAAVFSFNGNKIITTSGGGALISANRSIVDKAKFWANQSRENEIHYEHKEVGYNYRLSNLLAAVGTAQLEVLEERVKARRRNFEYYRTNISGATFHKELPGEVSNRWLSCALLKNKSPFDLVKTFASAGIEARPLWKPMHVQPVFSGCISYLNGVSEDFFKKGICLPSGSALKEKELEEIARIVSC